MDKKDQRRKTFIIVIDIVFALLYALLVASMLVAWGMMRLVESWAFLYFFFILGAAVIVGTLFGAFRYYSNSHGIVDRKLEKKFLKIISLVLLASSLLSIAGIEIKRHDIHTYTREKWINKDYDRGRLIESFLEQVDLKNKSEDEVIHYLGEPDYIRKSNESEEFSFAYNYNLGGYLNWFDGSDFDVYFNEENKVISAQIVHH